MRRLAFVLLLAALAALNGCAYSAYGLYDDQRLMDTITDDKTLATSIKTALMDENFSGGWSIAVYSYYGNVFLVGEVPQNMQGKALAIARRYKPRSVTPHWFSPAKSDTSNFALAASLRTDLIGAKGLSSTRIDTEVNAGRVVLLGVVKDDEEKQIAIRTARKVKGVTSVTSYLMLPQRPGPPPRGSGQKGGSGRRGRAGPAPGPDSGPTARPECASGATQGRAVPTGEHISPEQRRYVEGTRLWRVPFSLRFQKRSSKRAAPPWPPKGVTVFGVRAFQRLKCSDYRNQPFRNAPPRRRTAASGSASSLAQAAAAWASTRPTRSRASSAPSTQMLTAPCNMSPGPSSGPRMPSTGTPAPAAKPTSTPAS